LTGSRGGLIALAVALVAFLIIGARARRHVIVVIVLVALAGTGYYQSVASPEQRARVTELNSGTGRTDLWEVAWRMVEDKPVQGVGAGNFTVSSPRYLIAPGSIARADFFIGEKPKVTHNTYLQIWAELGTTGLVLFVSILAFGLYAAGSATRIFARLGDASMQAIARAVFVAFAAVVAADFFGSRHYSRELWVLLGLAAAVLAIARAREDSEAV
jgi:O-antigen ligase